MSEELIIREAIPDDAQKLIDFLNKVSTESSFIEHDVTDNVTEDDERLSLDEIYNSAHDELMLAILGDEIIGFSRLEQLDEFESEFGIVVEKDFWNNGVGSYLTEDILAYAKESPIKKVSLEVYKNNPAAIHLYEAHGFATRSEKHKTIIMEKMV
ncbi:GNAT family N-acetyltransferase [Companilactobacillus ginsenosidimutans]|uniref:GNAT family acetyltransferase n=1 Tax=Companilactobacillus ginsenosidimutans TaxID=1007676 RepID=A0A0H4QIK5_9LACO|nr:GNAT family N-acetyltransferase [Companilactobacillus ginsenosidimutans]AKP68259.1 GNAT family acetyltransferase [Companilactobacillus ginsenosidimutans]